MLKFNVLSCSSGKVLGCFGSLKAPKKMFSGGAIVGNCLNTQKMNMELLCTRQHGFQGCREFQHHISLYTFSKVVCGLVLGSLPDRDLSMFDPFLLS